MDGEISEDTEHHPEGPAWPSVGSDGGLQNEEEYVGNTNEVSVASEVAGEDEMARTSEGDVTTTGAREGEDRSEGGSAMMRRWLRLG